MNAIMSNFDLDSADINRSSKWEGLSEIDRSSKWEGLSEIDQAIRENRLMEYRIKKSWADPWGRKLTIAVLIVIVLGFSFLAGTSFRLW